MHIGLEGLYSIDGMLVRGPEATSYHGSSIGYWEPIISYLPNDEVELIKAFQKMKSEGLKARVDLPLGSKIGTHRYEYWDIELDSWPNISHINSDYTRSYRKMYDKILEDDKKVKFKFCSPSIWEESDAYTMLAANIQGIKLEGLELYLNDEKVASFTVRIRGDYLESVSLYRHSDTVASVVTWHLINWWHNLNPQGKVDIWNVALNDRENYKKMFFGNKVWRNCFYSGDPLEWMTTVHRP